jgi:hypothetical protein
MPARRPVTQTVVAILAVVVMCVAAAAATAKEATYTSYPNYVEKVSGPNQYPIDENWGENTTGKGVCSRIWEYLGGSSYQEVASTCSGEWYGLGTSTSCSVNGHGTAARYYSYTYILNGWQHYNGCA